MRIERVLLLLLILTLVFINIPHFMDAKTSDEKRITRFVKKKDGVPTAEEAIKNIENIVLTPRPADAEERKKAGFPDPRSQKTILEELQKIDSEIELIQSLDEIYKKRYTEIPALRMARINLISEIEEAQFKGELLQHLLNKKVRDLHEIMYHIRSIEWTYDRLLSVLQKKYPNSAVTLEAKAHQLLFRVQSFPRMKMKIHPVDLDALATFEKSRQNHPDAGLILMEALVVYRDKPDIQNQWMDWMYEHLGKDSYGFRRVVRDRMFGKSIQLSGSGFDGSHYNTLQWLGDVIIVDFWGTWCAPCISSMPFLKTLYEKYSSKGLRILGVLCDWQVDRAQIFTEENGYHWPQLVDRSLTPEELNHPIARQYAIGAYPTYWIIDRQGIVHSFCSTNIHDMEAIILKHLDIKEISE